jgi:hypothetical protein
VDPDRLHMFCAVLTIHAVMVAVRLFKVVYCLKKPVWRHNSGTILVWLQLQKELRAGKK